MAIIPHKEIYDDSKKAFGNLNKELDSLDKKVKDLTKSNKALSTSLQNVKKSNDGTEARKLADGTEKLNKLSLKLKDTLTATDNVKKQILRQNAKLHESRTKEAKDLALVRQKTLEQNKANRELAKSQLGVKKSTNGLISSFKAMGKQLAGALGVTAIIGLLVNQFKKASERATELNKLTRQLQGTFDITTREAKRLASQINAMAQNFEDIDAKALQTSLTVIVKTFKDLSEQEALGLIQEGFQKGSNNSGEFLDILKEYPSFFKKAGLSASEMFAIINQQVKEGVYSDKGVDAIKEATISLTENTQIVKDALRPLGESVNLQIRQKVEAGKAFEAMQLISKEMETLGVNSAEAQTIMADVFKGAGEDSDAFVRNLHNVNLSLEDVAKQTSIVSEANLELSKSYNNFLLSVEDGTGTISNAIASITDIGTEFLKTATIFNETNIENKLKIIANAALSLFETAFLPLAKVLDILGIKMPRFNVEVEDNTESIEDNTEAVKENEKELVKEEKTITKLTAAQIKQNEALKESNRLKEEERIKKERQKDLVGEAGRDADQMVALRKQLAEGVISQTEFNKKIAELNNDFRLNEIERKKKSVKVELTEDQKLEDNKFQIREDARIKEAEAEAEKFEKILERAQEIEDAKLAIQEAAITSGQQLASDIFSSFQDEKLAKLQTDADAEKAILQDKLDKGVISEEQFVEQVAAIEQKQRIASAKAERKKALFDIGIATAIAVIKTFANLGFPLGIPAALAVGVIGAIQAAAVLAKPIPKFAEGGEIGGQSHAKGGTILEGEKGEFVVNKASYTDSKDVVNMVNDGILTDKSFSQMTKQDNNMMLAGLLMQGNQNGSDMIELLSRLGLVYKKGNENYIERASGKIERFI